MFHDFVMLFYLHLIVEAAAVRFASVLILVEQKDISDVVFSSRMRQMGTWQASKHKIRIQSGWVEAKSELNFEFKWNIYVNLSLKYMVLPFSIHWSMLCIIFPATFSCVVCCCYCILWGGLSRIISHIGHLGDTSLCVKKLMVSSFFFNSNRNFFADRFLGWSALLFGWCWQCLVSDFILCSPSHKIIFAWNEYVHI